MQLSGLIPATLQRRYKRFLADVVLDDGTPLTVHCPNTGAMTGCAPDGARVWLSHSDNKTRKYPHTWELVETPQGMACIHSARANKVVREGIEQGRLPEFAPYPSIQSEVRYGEGSRADLLLSNDDARVFVEVKSVTLCLEEGLGAFPDAVSARAQKHIRELVNVVDECTRAVLVFCVMHEGIQRVTGARHIDPAYCETLAAGIEAGLEVQAWRCAVSDAALTLAEPLPFSLDAV